YTHDLATRTKWWTLDTYIVLDLVTIPPTITYAIGAVVLLTLLNLLGVVLGKTAQNILSVIKLLGLLAIIVAGFAFAHWPSAEEKREVFLGEVVSVSGGQVVVQDAEGSKRTFGIGDKTRVTINRQDSADDKKNTAENLGAALKANRQALAEETAKAEKALLEKAAESAKKGKAMDPAELRRELEETRKALERNHALHVKVFTRSGAPAEEPVAQVKTTKLFDWRVLLALGGPMILIMLAYGGWNDAAFVAAEVRERDRNLPRALLGGTALIALLYVLVNGAYLFGLGAERAEESERIAADTLGLLPGTLGEYGSIVMSILVMIAALGAVNGLIYTSSRIYSTLGSDYSLFAPLGKWNKTLGTPVWSLLLQLVLTLTMLVMVGTTQGREVINDGLQKLGFEKVQAWYIGGFFPLLQCSAPIFWLFFLMAGLSLFVLRINEPHVERPFRVPLFPLVPLLFCVTCGYMLYSGIMFARQLGVVGAVLVLLGLPFYIFSRRSKLAEGQPGTTLPSDEPEIKL
ncbi:MAG TPA: amino acid permease, partial [Gemmataceae bacterium]|nr:amino acid permease [Gemmataceae bacterium]